MLNPRGRLPDTLLAFVVCGALHALLHRSDSRPSSVGFAACFVVVFLGVKLVLGHALSS